MVGKGDIQLEAFDVDLIGVRVNTSDPVSQSTLAPEPVPDVLHDGWLPIPDDDPTATDIPEPYLLTNLTQPKLKGEISVLMEEEHPW